MKRRFGQDRVLKNCYPAGQNGSLQIIGIILIVIGLILLFICIPGWAWAAIIGLVLILVGYVLIQLNSFRR